MALEIEFARDHMGEGTRGPSMTFLYRHGGGIIGCGTIFFHECPGGGAVETVQDALDYVAANLPWITSELARSNGPGLDQDRPVSNGWKHRTNPAQIKRAGWIETAMMEKAKTFVGWD